MAGPRATERRVTVRLCAVLAFGLVAVLARADYRLVAGVAVMACAALGWRGPLPTIVVGSKPED